MSTERKVKPQIVDLLATEAKITADSIGQLPDDEWFDSQSLLAFIDVDEVDDDDDEDMEEDGNDDDDGEDEDDDESQEN